MVMATLRGRDHEAPDAIADASVDDRTALALSRGRLPKPYDYVDPNEDVLLAAVGPIGSLLVVADGHNGMDASHGAVAALEPIAEALLHSASDPSAIVAECMAAARDGIAAALGGAPAARGLSRTALSVALVSDGSLHTATAGDTSVVVVRRGKGKLASGTGPFYGPRSDLPSVQRTRLRDGDLVVAVSDGVSDYLGRRWLASLAATTSGSDSARLGAVALVRLALDGGAGDNVAVAISAPRSRGGEA